MRYGYFFHFFALSFFANEGWRFPAAKNKKAKPPARRTKQENKKTAELRGLHPFNPVAGNQRNACGSSSDLFCFAFAKLSRPFPRGLQKNRSPCKPPARYFLRGLFAVDCRLIAKNYGGATVPEFHGLPYARRRGTEGRAGVLRSRRPPNSKNEKKYSGLAPKLSTINFFLYFKSACPLTLHSFFLSSLNIFFNKKNLLVGVSKIGFNTLKNISEYFVVCGKLYSKNFARRKKSDLKPKSLNKNHTKSDKNSTPEKE